MTKDLRLITVPHIEYYTRIDIFTYRSSSGKLGVSTSSIRSSSRLYILYWLCACFFHRYLHLSHCPSKTCLLNASTLGEFTTHVGRLFHKYTIQCISELLHRVSLFVFYKFCICALFFHEESVK